MEHVAVKVVPHLATIVSAYSFILNYRRRLHARAHNKWTLITYTNHIIYKKSAKYSINTKLKLDTNK